MHRRFASVLMVGVVGLVGCAGVGKVERGVATGPRVDGEVVRVRGVLAERYPHTDIVDGRKMQFDAKSPLEEVATPMLAGKLPGVRFFHTRLKTGWADYRVVEAVVVAERGGAVEVWFEPSFDDAGAKMLAMLKGVRVEGYEEKHGVGEEIAQLVAAMVPGTEVRAPAQGESYFAAGVWRKVRRGTADPEYSILDDYPMWTVEVKFAEGAVEKVEVKPGFVLRSCFGPE